jgi:hypothetical protein
MKTPLLIRGLVIFVSLLFVLITATGGCGKSSPGSPSTEDESSQADIPASTGGNISFSDGAEVTIPAGALSENKTITVNKIGSNSLPDRVLSAIYVSTLESLSVPATVTLKYDPNKIGSDQEIVVGVVGGATPSEEASSSEVSVVQYITPEAIDSSKGTITVKTSHFSFVWAFCQDKAYLVFDFGVGDEYKYLKPGDIMYALTGAGGFTQGFSYNGSWCPGHVAMYLGTVEGSGINHLIESTVNKDLTGINGVQYGRTDQFRTQGHIFMGARRPKDTALTNELRAKIVKNAKAKLGWPYFYINFDSFGVPLASGVLAGPKTGITCVALVKNSYNEAGIYNVSALRQYLFFPIDQFNNTEPVKDITVKVNDMVKFYVYGVTRNNYLTYSKWRTYLDREQYYDVSVVSPNLNITSYDRYPTNDDPDKTNKVYGTSPRFFKKAIDANGATHGDNYPFFKWVPASTEVGTYDLTFLLDAGDNGKKEETVKITVLPK